MFDGSIAYLLIDIRLGARIDGWEVARRARGLHPRLPVVYMTGVSSTKWEANGVPGSIVLQKPFAFERMSSTMSLVMKDELQP